MKTIFIHFGVMITGLGDRSEASNHFCYPSPNWGDVRVKKMTCNPMKWAQPDAVARALVAIKEQGKQRYCWTTTPLHYYYLVFVVLTSTSTFYISKH
jgi:hypothetical protein